jgi:hypothetical protein
VVWWWGGWGGVGVGGVVDWRSKRRAFGTHHDLLNGDLFALWMFDSWLVDSLIDKAHHSSVMDNVSRMVWSM